MIGEGKLAAYPSYLNTYKHTDFFNTGGERIERAY